MICYFCNGAGEFRYFMHGNCPPGTPEWVRVPCKECGGMAIIHCCEGEINNDLRAMPTDHPDGACLTSASASAGSGTLSLAGL